MPPKIATTQNKPANSPIIAIDLLRAVAALGVFFYHSRVGALLVKYTGLSFLGFIDLFGAIYAVPLFFLLSGYCIHASNIRFIKSGERLLLRNYYVRRFFRIYPAYLVAVLFAVLVQWIAQPAYIINKVDFFVHLFALQGLSATYFNTINVVLWTITIELEFYIIYPIFYYLRRRFGLNTATIFTLFVSAISIAYFLYKGDMSYQRRYCVFNIWFAWCAGAYLADKNLIEPGSLKKIVYPAIYVLILIAFYLTKYLPDEFIIITYQLRILIWTAPLMITIGCETWFRKWKHLWIVRVLAGVGLSSYSLYLFHEPLTNFKNIIIHKYFPVSLQPVLLVAGIFVIPVITWCSYKYIEIPFISRSKPAVKRQ